MAEREKEKIKQTFTIGGHKIIIFEPPELENTSTAQCEAVDKALGTASGSRLKQDQSAGIEDTGEIHCKNVILPCCSKGRFYPEDSLSSCEQGLSQNKPTISPISRQTDCTDRDVHLLLKENSRRTFSVKDKEVNRSKYDEVTFFDPSQQVSYIRKETNVQKYDLITFFELPKGVPDVESKPPVKLAQKKLQKILSLKRSPRKFPRTVSSTGDEMPVSNPRRPWIPVGYYKYPNCACGLGIHVNQECKLAVERMEKSIELWKSKGDSKYVDLKGHQFLDFKLQEEYAKVLFGEKAGSLPLNRSNIIYSSKMKTNWTKYPQGGISYATTFLVFGNYKHQHDDMIWRCDMGLSVITPFLWRFFAGLPVNPMIPTNAAIVAFNDEIWILGGKTGTTLIQHCGILAAHLNFFRNAMQRLMPNWGVAKIIELPLEPTNFIYRYNVVTKRMDKLKEMNTPRFHHQAAVVNEKLFVIGGVGKDEKPLKSVEMYNQQHDIWEFTTSSMPLPCYGMAACSFQNQLYVLGGITVSGGQRTLLDQVLVMDMATMKWKTLKTRLPHPSAFMAAVEHNKSLFLIGGINSLSPVQITQSVYIYDVGLDIWLEGFPLHIPRTDRLYVFGGRAIDGQNIADAEHLLNNGLGWYKDVYIPVATAGQQLAVIKTEFLPATGHVI